MIIIEYAILDIHPSRLLYFLLGLCVNLDDIYMFCMIAWCLVALILCVCMLLVCVGRTSIPLPSTLWFRSFPSSRLLPLQV